VCTKQDQEKEQGIELPVSHTLSDGGAENAGVAKMQGWKTRDWKMQESEKYGKRRFQKRVSDCTD